MKKVVAIHLFNDFSGSPLVLSQVLEGFIKSGVEVDLYTSKSSGEGFLSDIEGVNNYTYPYKWHPNKWITLFRFMTSQLGLLFKLLKYRNQDVVFYVNTVLPFGASLCGKLIGKPVLYHIHETSVKPEIFKKMLFGFARKCANKAIYVSEFLAKEEGIQGLDSEVVYNALSKQFLSKVDKQVCNDFIVLMLCSLKGYKGVWQFLELAQRLPDLKFELVLNAEQYEIDDFFKTISFPENLKIFPAQSNVHPFYQRASLVLNLSKPDEWVETFGMTALEAFAYKIPVIVPPVGGIMEVVDHELNGYHIDSRDVDELVTKVDFLSKNRGQYQEMSEQTVVSLNRFDVELLQKKTLSLVESVR